MKKHQDLIQTLVDVFAAQQSDGIANAIAVAEGISTIAGGVSNFIGNQISKIDSIITSKK